MCGRYAGFLPAEAMARIFGTMNSAAQSRSQHARMKGPWCAQHPFLERDETQTDTVGLAATAHKHRTITTRARRSISRPCDA